MGYLKKYQFLKKGCVAILAQSCSHGAVSRAIGPTWVAGSVPGPRAGPSPSAGLKGACNAPSGESPGDACNAPSGESPSDQGPYTAATAAAT